MTCPSDTSHICCDWHQFVVIVSFLAIFWASFTQPKHTGSAQTRTVASAVLCTGDMPCLGQEAAAQEDGEGVAAGVGVARLQDLDAAVREGVQAVRAPVAVQRAAVVPHAVEAQHLPPRTFTII